MTSELYSFEIEADVYRVQRRPNHAQLVVNDDYQGLRVLDPWTGLDVVRVQFGDGYSTGGGIDSWALRADGAMVVVFNDEEGHACLMSFVDGQVLRVKHPPWTSTVGMPYDWRGDTLWMKDPDSFSFGVLAADMVTAEKDGTEALSENRAWRRAIDRMRRAQARCLRVEPERAHALVVARPEGEALRIGRIGWVEQPEPMVEVPERVARLASAGEQFVALYEYEAILLGSEGQVERRYAAPPGFHYVDLDTVPAFDGHPPALVLAACALDGRLLTRFLIHSLQ